MVLPTYWTPLISVMITTALAPWAIQSKGSAPKSSMMSFSAPWSYCTIKYQM